MQDFVVSETRGAIALLTLNRPHILNAWHTAMRDMLVSKLLEAEADEAIRAIVMTGSGDRAFCAGQDLNETKTFDPDRAEEWIREWERLYDTIRSLSKPLIMALNGLAAGSAFQVALLADFRIAHPGVDHGPAGDQFGHREHDRTVDHAGDARTIAHDRSDPDRPHDGGAGMPCASAWSTAWCPPRQVLPEALALAEELAAKPPVAMRLEQGALPRGDRGRIPRLPRRGHPQSAESPTRPASRRA